LSLCDHFDLKKKMENRKLSSSSQFSTPTSSPFKSVVQREIEIHKEDEIKIIKKRSVLTSSPNRQAYTGKITEPMYFISDNIDRGHALIIGDLSTDETSADASPKSKGCIRKKLGKSTLAITDTILGKSNPKYSQSSLNSLSKELKFTPHYIVPFKNKIVEIQDISDYTIKSIETDDNKNKLEICPKSTISISKSQNVSTRSINDTGSSIGTKPINNNSNKDGKNVSLEIDNQLASINENSKLYSEDTMISNLEKSEEIKLDTALSNRGSSSQIREQWGHKTEFLLAIIGFSVDLGNIWRCK
jgi:hypothetical protein